MNAAKEIEAYTKCAGNHARTPRTAPTNEADVFWQIEIYVLNRAILAYQPRVKITDE